MNNNTELKFFQPHNSLTSKQEKTLVSLIWQIGKERYRHHKVAVKIPIETTLLRLTRQQAMRLIASIIDELRSRQNE